MSDDIERLVALRQSGHLTEAEFAQAKSKILEAAQLDETSAGKRIALPVLARNGWRGKFTMPILVVVTVFAVGVGFFGLWRFFGDAAPVASTPSGRSTSEPASETSSPPATPSAGVPLDVALSRARAVVPELGSAPDEVVSQIAGSMCLGLATGKKAPDLLGIAEAAGLSRRESIALVLVASTSVCPDRGPQVVAELTDAGINMPAFVP
jgi:hypothetical protein